MSITEGRWFHRRGALARDGWESVVDASMPGWEHTGLRVGELSGGDQLELDETGIERIVVPLAGSFTVDHAESGVSARTELAGRTSVFDGPTDVLFLSAATTAVIKGEGVSLSRRRRPTRSVPLGISPPERRPSSCGGRARRAGRCTTSAPRRRWMRAG